MARPLLIVPVMTTTQIETSIQQIRKEMAAVSAEEARVMERKLLWWMKQKAK
jgi:hypothetical protein